jgi:uncharacterized protein (TIGR02266 family)
MLPDRSFAQLFTPTHTESTDPSERRGTPRIPLQTEVVVATESNFFSGLSVDINEGGIFVSTFRPLEIGDRVSIEFTLNEGQVLARGRVQWLRKGESGQLPGIGVAFDEMSPEDVERVHGFCRRRPRFYTYDEVVRETARLCQ